MGICRMNTVQLVSAGLSMGLLHVVAGPDHLSALAALSVGSSWKAVWMGIRWGIGHSSGLIVVAILFIAAKGDIDLRTIGRYFDMIVGFFMIGIGCFGLIQLIKIRNERNLKKYIDMDVNLDMESQSLLPADNRNGTETMVKPFALERECVNETQISSFSVPHVSTQKYDAGGANFSNQTDLNSKLSSNSSVFGDDHVDDAKKLLQICRSKCPWYMWQCTNSFCSLCGRMCGLQPTPVTTSPTHVMSSDDIHNPVTQNLLSFVIGVIHGVAGPGGILGVLPAVEMTNISSSVIYLGSFIFASTLSMGLFAALYGEVTKRLSATADFMEYLLRLFSCTISIVVGCLWIVLSAMGQLDKYFH